MEKQDILDYVSKTPENVNVNVLGGMLDELASGGGGGGDVTWAKVKFINVDTSTMYFVHNITSIVNTEYFEIINTLQEIDVQDESEVTVPLYKGKYAIHPNAFQAIDTSFFPQVTGGVTLDMESQFIVVTGDGTITFKGSRWE